MKPAAAISCLLLFSGLCLSLFQGISVAGAVDAGAIAVPTIPPANMDVPAPKITPPNMDMPDTKPKMQSELENNSSASQMQAGNASHEAERDLGDAISGKWTVRFQEMRDRALDLTLWSAGREKVMGFGALTKGSTTVSMSASGSFAGEELLLAVKSAQPEYEGAKSEQYDLDLLLENDTLSGSYILRAGGQISSSGNATASRRA